ncbi:MAG: DNA methyltransferase [Candidatus Nanopelagicales bacterium]|nr:DNA methyltransferase [Candidatus Nanopelagicales bacterium]
MISAPEEALRAILELVDRQAFTRLFTEDLAWNRPEQPPVAITIDDQPVSVKQVANYRGLGVWHCPVIPPHGGQRRVDATLAVRSAERLIIFTDADRQEWRWPRYANHRGIGNPRLVNHPHAVGERNANLVERLTRITIDPTANTTLPELLQRMRDAFDAEAEKASVAAARLMGTLYEQLSTAGVNDADASVILARVLFLMFGDDTSMWASNLFHDYLTDHTDPNGQDLAERLHDIFTVVDTPMHERPSSAPPHLNRLPYINGGIFHDPVTIPAALPQTLRRDLIEACKFDWGQISPAVFGSMFQEVKSAEERRALGEHYTTEENILKTIDPLFMDELRERLAAAWDSKGQLTRLHNSLKDLRFLDPACGCGNFLVVAYRELRAFELELLKRRRDLDELDGRRTGRDRSQLSLDATIDLNVTIDQFHGIEIEPWPARIAETAMFLVDHQANLRMEQDLGQAPDRLPIQVTAHITIGNAITTDWAALLPPNDRVCIFGNPPFSGQYTKTAAQTRDTRHVWGDLYNGYLDYVTCWHKKTLDYFGQRHNGRWAFVTTNSVNQGEATAPLWRPILANGWRCRFAHRSLAWTSEAAGKAGVHVSIVGFDRGIRDPSPILWTYPEGGRGYPTETGLQRICPYLIDFPRDVLVDPETHPIAAGLAEVTYGSKPTDGGNLLVSPTQYEEVAGDPIAARYLRRYFGAKELLHDRRRWCLWLQSAPPEDLEASQVLRTRVAAVRKMRAGSSDAQTQRASDWPHRFQYVRQPATNYLAIPAHVSELRRYFVAAYLPPDVICSNANFLAPDPDGYLLGVLSSTMFITWMKAVGGRLKSDIRFSNTFGYNTFPLPPAAANHLSALSDAARGVVLARAHHPHASLAELYNPHAMPSDLLAAHERIDAVIDPLFGLAPTPALTDRQAALFAMYSQLTGR